MMPTFPRSPDLGGADEQRGRPARPNILETFEYGRELLRQNTAGARNRRGGLSFPPDRMKPNFMKGRYGSMTPGFEIALAIGLVVGFALGYSVRALISYRRHQAARRRYLF